LIDLAAAQRKVPLTIGGFHVHADAANKLIMSEF